MSEAPKVYSAGAINALISQRYPAPEYATYFEVRDATGFSSRNPRSADAISMSIWPSRGLVLHGFEVKVARGDWTRELKAPDKAEPIARFCHFWWVVAPDTKVVPVEELPDAWGLLVVGKKGKLSVAKEAPRKEPMPVTYQFLASMLRAGSDGFVPKAQLDELVRIRADEALDKKTKRIQEDAKFQAEMRDKACAHAERLQRTVSELERYFGVDLGDAQSWQAQRRGYTAEQARAAVSAILRGDDVTSQIQDQLRVHERAAEGLRAALALGEEQRKAG